MKRFRFRLRIPCAVVAALAVCSLVVPAAPPAWWDQEPSVVNPDADPNNHGPANIGQAKWMAKRALDAVRSVNSSLAASIEADLVGDGKPITSWDPPSTQDQKDQQLAPLLVGQLKAISKPFYQQINGFGPASAAWLDAELQNNHTKVDGSIYSWNPATAGDANYGMAALGQLKAVFCLRFTDVDAGGASPFAAAVASDGNTDLNANGLPDQWEYAEIARLVAANPPRWSYLSCTGALDPSTSYWDDGLTAAQSVELGFSGENRTLSSTRQSDSDGVDDSEDADPLDPVVDWPPAAEASYAVIELGCESGGSSTIGASINRNGDVLWTEHVKYKTSNGFENWQTSSRVWKGGAWSPNLRMSPAEFESCKVQTDYTYYNEEMRSTTVDAIPYRPGVFESDDPGVLKIAEAFPEALCGDRVVGTGDYYGTRNDLEWRDDEGFMYYYSDSNPEYTYYHDINGLYGLWHGKIFRFGDNNDQADDEAGPMSIPIGCDVLTVDRNDGVANGSIFNVAILWELQAGTNSWYACPLAPQTVSETNPFGPQDINQDSSRLSASIRAEEYQYGAIGSPGGALAILGGEQTPADRKWKIWIPPAAPCASPYSPGEGTPARERHYVENGRVLQITAIEDGGSVAGFSHAGDSVWSDPHLQVIDETGEQELPDSGYWWSEVNAMCRVDFTRNGTDESRLVAAGSDLWVRKNGTWSKAVHQPTVSPVIGVAADGVLLGYQSIWRNGREVPLDKLVEGLKAGNVPRYTNLSGFAMNAEGAIVALADDALHPGSWNKTLVLLQPTGAEIIPDYNRDGKIDEADRGKATTTHPWRFWSNDDHDYGDVDGTDIPNDSQQDYCGNTIKGTRDLIDYFPAKLEIRKLLQIFPANSYKYYLSYDPVTYWKDNSSTGFGSPFLKVVWNPEAKAEADGVTTLSGNWQKDITNASVLLGKSVQMVNPGAGIGQGTELQVPDDMLQAAAAGDGLIWVEAAGKSDSPLVLQVYNSQNQWITSAILPLSISGVEDMFRHHNMRGITGGTGGADNRPVPTNWPDADRNGKTFLFVHGYNVNGESSRGWSSEFFKRMFWSGSNARFVSVSWRGDQSQENIPITNILVTPDYQANVDNAFGTASALKDVISSYGPGVTVAAHSLGNMLVGSAIHDCGARPENYYMIDAAVPKEAYDPSEADDSAQDGKMTPSFWLPYDKRLRPSEWYALPWPPLDERTKLKWRGRLSGVVSSGVNVYNFYSSEEEVLANPEPNNPDDQEPGYLLPWLTVDKTWAVQEKRKGFGLTGYVHTSNYGGWRFNCDALDLMIQSPEVGIGYRMKSPSAITMNDSLLIHLETVPFFDSKSLSSPSDLYDAQTGASSPGSIYAHNKRNTLLAQMIPATSFAAGRNAFKSVIKDRQIDMAEVRISTPNWPIRDGKQEWHHCDLREIAYLYTYPVFDEFVKDANLDQIDNQ
jgi:hypothetical protein